MVAGKKMTNEDYQQGKKMTSPVGSQRKMTSEVISKAGEKQVKKKKDYSKKMSSEITSRRQLLEEDDPGTFTPETNLFVEKTSVTRSRCPLISLDDKKMTTTLVSSYKKRFIEDNQKTTKKTSLKTTPLKRPGGRRPGPNSPATTKTTS